MQAGVGVTVLERHPELIGGISRTETYKGFRSDVGGHRFFSRSGEIEALWQEILGDQLLTRNRKSRIFYLGRLFDYLVRPLNALTGLGLLEAARCMLSYARPKLLPNRDPQTFEEWVTPLRVDTFKEIYLTLAHLLSRHFAWKAPQAAKSFSSLATAFIRPIV